LIITELLFRNQYVNQNFALISPANAASVEITFDNQLADLVLLDAICFTQIPTPYVFIDNNTAFEGNDLTFTIIVSEIR